MVVFLHGGSHEDLHVQGNNSAKPWASMRTVLQAFKNKAKFVLKMCLQPASSVFSNRLRAHIIGAERWGTPTILLALVAYLLSLTKRGNIWPSV